MGLDPSRLRWGEWIVGAGAIVLLASMFLLTWYGLSAEARPTAASLGLSTSLTGWEALTHLRWLMLVTIAAAFALCYLQAARRSPALPTSFSVIVSALGVLTAVGLIYRVLINEPGSDSVVVQKPGAFVGLVSALAIAYGGYRSMREEGVGQKDGPQEIKTVKLHGASGS